MADLRLGAVTTPKRHGELLAKLGKIPSDCGLVPIAGFLPVGVSACHPLASRDSSPLHLPRCWFAINVDEPGGGLVLVALNRIESPLSVVCFAFSREVDAMALGIRVPLRSLSGQESMLEFRLQLTTLDTRMDTIERQNS